MRKRLGVLTGVTAVIIGVLGGPAAHAAGTTDAPSADDLTAQQREAIAAWSASGSNVSRDAAARSSSRPAAAGGAAATAGARAASSGGVSTIRLYRGSWLMWAEESVQYNWSGDGRTVNWSSAWQSSGAIFPNNVTKLGTRKYFSSSTEHRWRGGYTVGAGVPTPWGNANVYNATSYAESIIKNIGSIQRWLN
jgi:hypothetical protein